MLNQNLSISKVAIYHPRRPSWPGKKGPYLRTLLSPICLECVKKKFYVNKMKLKWQNCIKQKKIIELRESL